MLRALFVGDLHLDKLQKLFPHNHLELQFNEVNKVCTYAIKNGYEHVIFLGDIGDKPTLSYDAITAFITFFAKWSESLKLYFILGNHDFAETGVHSMQPFVAWQEFKHYKNIHVFDKPKVVEIGGVPVNFSSYPATKSYANTINIGHFETSGSTGDNGRVIRKAVETEPRHLWVMGHLHTPHTINQVYYCGTLYQLNFGESLPKGFMKIKASMKKGKLKYEIKRVKTDPTFKLINLVVEDKDDLKKIEDNDLYKYKIFFKSNLSLTDKELSKYPNVVKLDGFSTKTELRSLVESSFIDFKEQSLKLPSQRVLLKKYFKAHGYTKEQFKRATEIIGI